MTATVPILIDCDTGIDDSLALLYAVASSEAEIVAVTCCSGNVEAHQVAQNTLAILELAGRPDIEVALGRTVPLVRALEVDARDPRAAGARPRRAAATEPARLGPARRGPHQRRGAPAAR